MNIYANSHAITKNHAAVLPSREDEASSSLTSEDYEFLLSTISHEIRNPVTLINSYLQLILASHPEIRSCKYWDTVNQEMLHLRSLLTSLSAFHNGLQLNPQELSATPWLTAYAEEARVLIQSLPSDPGAATLECRIPEGLPVCLLDPDKLRQVLDNLIRNAIEAGAARILLSARAASGMLILGVSDNGCGISPEKQQDLFRPFVTHKKDGTGLGLAIAKRIINAHHGTISVHSEPGSMTEFTIKIPGSRQE